MPTDKLSIAPSKGSSKPQRKDTSAKLAAKFSSIPSDDADTHCDAAPAPLSSLDDFSPCSLTDIRRRLKSLMAALPADLPPLPSDDSSHSAVSAFASRLQIVIEQFNLLLSLVGSATYQWGVDRSGASQQNLGVMVAELQTCQEMISSGVSGRLSNVLCPAVDVMVGEVEIIRGEGVNDDGANLHY